MAPRIRAQQAELDSLKQRFNELQLQKATPAKEGQDVADLAKIVGRMMPVGLVAMSPSEREELDDLLMMSPMLGAMMVADLSDKLRADWKAKT